MSTYIDLLSTYIRCFDYFSKILFAQNSWFSCTMTCFVNCNCVSILLNPLLEAQANAVISTYINSVYCGTSVIHFRCTYFQLYCWIALIYSLSLHCELVLLYNIGFLSIQSYLENTLLSLIPIASFLIAIITIMSSRDLCSQLFLLHQDQFP